jgi:hypothetical protein
LPPMVPRIPEIDLIKLTFLFFCVEMAKITEQH